MHFGFLEIIAIFGIIILFVGPKQLPKLAKSVKDSKKIVKEEMEEGQEEDSHTVIKTEDAGAAHEQ